GQLPHYRIRRNLADPTAATGEENVQSFWSLGLDAQHRAYLPGGVRAIGGAMVDRSPSSYPATLVTPTRDPGTGVYTAYAPADSPLSGYSVRLLGLAAYGHVDARPTPGLRLPGGLGYARLRYDYDNRPPPAASSGASAQFNTFGRLSPRLGATL